MRPLALLVSVVSFGAISCGSGAPLQKPTTHAASAGDARPPAPPAPLEGAPAKAGAPEIAFIENDYARALLLAKTQKLPLFIDVWAPWCHTCLSMRAYVFADEPMKKRAGDFVWLAIDSENDTNAAFLDKYPVKELPTFWVVDAAAEKPALKWLGSATAPELLGLLDDALLAIHHGDTGGEAGAQLLLGHQETAAGHGESAVKAYRAALAAAPPGWAKRSEVVDALTERLAALKQYADCVDLALAEISSMQPGTALSDTVQTAINAAEELPKTAPSRGEALSRLATKVRDLATDPSLPILADDRSGLFEHLVYATRDDAVASRKAASDWAAFLENQASRAPNAAARAVFDAHRLNAYIELGPKAILERGVPMLQQSERDFPKDYNPSARLARAFFELKRPADALAEVDRALTLAYGGRKLRIYDLRADIQKARGDAAGEAQTLRAAVADAKTMTLNAGYSKLRDALVARLAALK